MDESVFSSLPELQAMLHDCTDPNKIVHEDEEPFDMQGTEQAI
jgi:hypothetical protein